MAINFLNKTRLPDNAKLTFGDVPDFEIYHNSSTNVNWISSLLDRQLILSSNYLYIKNQDQDESIASFLADGAVTLYYNAATKFATTNTGISITGGFVTTSSSDCAGLNMTSNIAMGSSDITDSNSSAGTAGQVLSSLGSGNGVDWVDATTGDITGVTAGNYLNGGGTSGTVTVNHDTTSRSDTTSSASPGSAGTFTAVDSVTTGTYGHITALNLKTVTMPTVIDPSGTYVPISGGSGVGQAMTGNLHIQNSGPKIYLKDTTDDDDQSIIFKNNADTIEYRIQTQDFTSGGGGDGFSIGSISSDPLRLVTANTTALTIDTSQNATFAGIISAPSYLRLNKAINQSTLPDVPDEHVITLSPPTTTDYYGGGISWSEGSNTAASIGVYDEGSGGALGMYLATGNNTTLTKALTIDDSQNATFAGTVTWSGGSSTESNSAYDNMITAFSDSGTSTVTLTLTQQDGGTLTTSFSVPQGTGDGTVTGVTSATTGQLTVSESSPAPALTIVTGAVTNGGTALATGDQIYDATTTRLSSYLPLTGGTLTGDLTISESSLFVTQGSATDPALRLTDTGVASYDFLFPDTSTIQLSTDTTSTKVFKISNAGTGKFNLDVEGTATINTIDVVGSDTDKFLMSDGGVVKYVTGTNLRSYIGAGTGSGDGTVTSVNVKTDGDALDTASNSITGSGTCTIPWQGSSSQYVNGEGNLVALSTLPQGDITNVSTTSPIGGGGSSGSVTITHDSQADTETTSSETLTSADTFTAYTSVTTNATGHVTGHNLKTYTLPTSVTSSGVTSITFTSDSGSTSAVTSTGTIDIEGGTNVTTSATGSTVTINSTDQYTGTVTSIATGSGLTGGTITTSGTLSHADTSSQASVDNSGRTFIQDITLDTFGHVTGITSATDSDTYDGTVTSITAGTGLDGGTITGSGTIDLADTAVTAASYTNASITVDAQGRLTAASSGSDAQGVTSITFTSDSGSTSAITSTGTIDIAGGTNVTTSATGSTVTINSTDQYTGTVTSVGITAGTGISVSGSPVTGSGSITVTNTAPATIDGSGASTRLAYWSDSDTLTSNAGLTYAAADHLTTTSQVRVGDGTKSAPSYSFDGDRNTGMYSGGTDIVAFSAGGNTSLLVESDKITAKTNIVLEDTNIEESVTLGSGETSGTIIKFGDAASKTAGKYYVWQSNSAWGETTPDGNATGLLAVSLGTGSSTATTNGMLLRGVLYDASHGFTIGAPLYLSDTDGTVTITPPTDGGYIVRVVGYALDTNHIYFCPDNTFIELS